MVSCPRLVPIAEVGSRVPPSLPEMSWPRLAHHWRSQPSGRTAGPAVRWTTTAPALPAVAGVLGGPADAGTAQRPAVRCRRPALRTHELDMVATCPSYIPRRCCHRKGIRRNASGPLHATSSTAVLPEVPDRAFRTPHTSAAEHENPSHRTVRRSSRSATTAPHGLSPRGRPCRTGPRNWRGAG